MHYIHKFLFTFVIQYISKIYELYIVSTFNFLKKTEIQRIKKAPKELNLT
jgi:hypothetical protein